MEKKSRKNRNKNQENIQKDPMSFYWKFISEYNV